MLKSNEFHSKTIDKKIIGGTILHPIDLIGDASRGFASSSQIEVASMHRPSCIYRPCLR